MRYEFILNVLCGTEIHMWKLRPSVCGIASATKLFVGFLLNSVCTFLTDCWLASMNGVRNRLSDSHVLLNEVNAFLSVFSILLR